MIYRIKINVVHISIKFVKIGNTDILPFGTNRGFLVMGGKVGTFQNGK